MKTFFLIVSLLLCFWGSPVEASHNAPFITTVSGEFNIIYSSDPTTFVDSLYRGRGERLILDRRFEEAIVVNAYVFRADYTDAPSIEFVVNPEFGSVEASKAQVDVYAYILGQLPFVLRACLRTIWINAGEGRFAIDTGAILIHTEHAEDYIGSGLIEEVLVHEASHVCLDSLYSTSLAWANAQEADGAYISDYAYDNPWEDAAESTLAWLAYDVHRDRISDLTAGEIGETMPNRIRFFDSLHLNMWPLAEFKFLINAGLNDAWVSEDAPFQGFFFTVYPDKELFFLSWFTFDSALPDIGTTAEFGAPDQRWVTGAGFYVDDSVTLNVELTSGGIFNDSNPTATQQANYGTITVTFEDCTEGTLSYEFPSLGLSGEMTIRRIVNDNVGLCEALNEPLMSGMAFVR